MSVRGLWCFSAAVAAGCHAWVVVSVLRNPPSAEIDDALAGNFVVELAPTYTTSLVPAETVPLGALSSASVESAAVVSSTTPARTLVDTPPVERAPVEPEVALPEPEPKVETKPSQEDHSKSSKEEKVSAASAASQAAAPAPIVAPIAKAPTAPQMGDTPQSRRAKLTWHKAIAMHIEKFKRYPAVANERRVPGTVIIEFTIDRQGSVRAREVQQSSGSVALDEAAIDMLQRASPLPHAPSDVGGTSFKMEIPIVFKLP